MLFSHVKISSFRAKAHLVFHLTWLYKTDAARCRKKKHFSGKKQLILKTKSYSKIVATINTKSAIFLSMILICFSTFSSKYLLYLQYNTNYTINICHFSFDYLSLLHFIFIITKYFPFTKNVFLVFLSLFNWNNYQIFVELI